MLLTALKYGFALWMLSAMARVCLSHSWADHWVALKKFAFIWIISTAPVICAALLSKPSPNIDPTRVGSEFDRTVYAAFSLGEQFVYAATFIAPVLYIFFEGIVLAAKTDPPERLDSIRRRVRGFGGLLLPTIILIILTVLSFAAARNPDAFKSTFLFLFLGTQSLIIYVLSLGLWYASVLLDTLPNLDFAEESRAESKRFSAAFRRRLNRESEGG
jgi:hypothetical protein